MRQDQVLVITNDGRSNYLETIQVKELNSAVG